MFVVVVWMCNCVQAYCFFGQELLGQEKCGDSIKVLQHSHARECVIHLLKSPLYRV